MYKIVLTENKVKIKTLHTYIRERDAKYRFNLINSEVGFLPKKTVYRDKKLIDVKYEVLMIKKNEGDYIDPNGPKLDDSDWVIVDKCDYVIEEQYNVTGANRKLVAEEILNHVLLNNTNESGIKQVVILNNKIVIEGLGIYMITCKNISEANRLYNKFRLHCFDEDVPNIIFFGTVHKENKSEWYKKIHKRTGTSYNRLYRSSSR